MFNTFFLKDLIEFYSSALLQFINEKELILTMDRYLSVYMQLVKADRVRAEWLAMTLAVLRGAWGSGVYLPVTKAPAYYSREIYTYFLWRSNR